MTESPMFFATNLQPIFGCAGMKIINDFKGYMVEAGRIAYYVASFLDAPAQAPLHSLTRTSCPLFSRRLRSFRFDSPVYITENLPAIAARFTFSGGGGENRTPVRRHSAQGGYMLSL